MAKNKKQVDSPKRVESLIDKFIEKSEQFYQSLSEQEHFDLEVEMRQLETVLDEEENAKI